MDPATQQDYSNWMGRQVVSSDGDKIGKVDDIYLDDRTGRPEWLAVTTGWFGTRKSFVPLADARTEGDEMVVPYGKDMVKDAPNIDHDGHLSPDEEMELYRHYGMSYSENDTDTHMDRDTDRKHAKRTEGRSSSDDAMTRSEEELEVGTRREKAGTARLRKWVETDHVETTVPVEREEVRVEREPITDANIDKAMSGPEITEAEHTEVLHEEHAVTNKNVVPKERVRLDKEVVTDEEKIEADVAKERIEVEGDARSKRR
jgi:uncharacterized protein (TIGR02271 family)